MASLLLIGKSNLDLKELSYDAYVAIAIAFVSSVKENPIHSLLKALKQRPGMNPSMEAASGNTGIKQFRFLVSIAAAAVRKSIIAIERNSTVFGSAFLPIPLGLSFMVTGGRERYCHKCSGGCTDGFEHKGLRDTDWEVDFDPTIVQLTDGLSCLDKRALRQSWAEKDGVWPRISLSPMHVQSCNAVEADDVSWGHMSVVDTDLVILIPIGHSRVFCAFRLVSDDSADSISLFYVNNQYPMTGWGKESKWCIYSPKWSLSPRLFPGHCSETSITLSAPTEPRKDRKAKVKAQIHALVPPLCERAPIAVTHVERVKARRNSKARMQAKARSQGQARVSPTEGNSITNEERYIPTAPKWLADECVESDSSLKCGWTTFPGEKSGRDKDTIPTAAGGGETFEPDTSTARSFGAVVPGLDCKGSRNALKLNEDPMLRLAASADALCLGTYFSYVVSTDGTWSPCASDRDRARNSPANEEEGTGATTGRGEYGRERSGIDSPITRLASATGKGTVAIASSPGQSSLPQRGVGSAKIDGKLPGLGFAISSVLSSVPCLDLFGFKVGVLFFHFQLS
ncbi:hypothetical protein Acr_00g0002650 [Actinidia rufa]|uniref:Uncharacterized protein n=1 Tax=Actinidia rufa TaxID=165716 RepID=A0A7J0D8M0_9ERIC|nr:hypothetical protein Acr_00g0002650 [Actinidia rufa]